MSSGAVILIDDDDDDESCRTSHRTSVSPFNWE